MECTKKNFLIAVFCLFSVIFIGCPARSLQPLFTENDLILNPSLIGMWKGEDVIYTFLEREGKKYTVIIRSTTSSDSSSYVVRLGAIGKQWFLDSYPAANSDEHHYLSVHTFSRIKLNGDTLRLASFEEDWLAKEIKSRNLKIPHVKHEDEIILTASPKELQKLFMKIWDNNDAFPNENVLTRIAP